MSSDRLAGRPLPYRFAVTGAAFAGLRLMFRRPALIAMATAVWMAVNLVSEVAWRAVPIEQPTVFPFLAALSYLLPVPPALAVTGLLIRPFGADWAGRFPAMLRLTLFWLVTGLLILLAVSVFIGGAMMLMAGRSGMVEMDSTSLQGAGGLTLLSLVAGVWLWGRLSVAAPLVAEGRPGALATGWKMTSGLQLLLAGAMILAGSMALSLLGAERIVSANFNTGPLTMQVQDGRLSSGGGLADPSTYGWAAVFGLAAGLAAVIMLAPGAAICGRNLSEDPDAQADVFA